METLLISPDRRNASKVLILHMYAFGVRPCLRLCKINQTCQGRALSFSVEDSYNVRVPGYALYSQYAHTR